MKIPILLFFAMTASASVIDFNTLTGTNQDRFSTYSEDGFTVTASQGFWSKEVLSDILCSRCGQGAVTITAGGDLFTYGGFDLGNNAMPGYLSRPFNLLDYFTIQGFRDGALVLSQDGSVAFAGGFKTYTNPAQAATLMDTLKISITSRFNNPPLNYTLDNIVVTSAAPEPGTLVLLLGGITLAFAARKLA
jgi:hypothetical protein